MVGQPIAITGTPKPSSVKASRLLPTPAPGLMPVLEIWMVVPILSTFWAARASTAITRPGLTFSTIPFITSKVSNPVMPKTPGAIPQVGRIPSTNASGACSW